MIYRMWRATVEPGRLDEYLDVLKDTGIKECLKHDGNIGVRVLTRPKGDEVEVLFLSLWDSIESVKKFAGSRREIAVLYPLAQEYLVERWETVEHFERIYSSDAP